VCGLQAEIGDQAIILKLLHKNVGMRVRANAGLYLAAGVMALALAGAAAAEPMLSYTVAQRDTLIGFSRDLLVDPDAWREVARINQLRDPDVLMPGQVLQVPQRLLRSTALSARIVLVQGDVRLDDQPVAAGAEMAVGQELAAGANSSAVLQLADGSRVQLAAASRAVLDEHARFEVKRSNAEPATGDEGWFAGAMRLVQGSLDVFAAKVMRAKPLEVRAPTAVVGVRGTEFRVRTDSAADAPTFSETLEGRVNVQPRAPAQPAAAAASTVDVSAGFGAAIDTTGGTTVRELLPPPDLSSLPERFERPLVRFALPSESRPLRVQVATESSFERVVADLQTPAGSEVRIDGLPDGAWFVRARRVDDIGIQGIDAARPFVLKARPEPPATTAPRPNAKLSVGEVELAWAENIDAARYELQVASDAAFTQAQPALNVTGADTRLALAEPGTYHWRIASIKADGDRGPWGDPLQFELRALPADPQSTADRDRITFNWSGRAEDRQQVELARDARFADVIARDEVQTGEWSVAQPGPGTYYFRYRSVEPDGFVTGWSSTLKIELKRDWRYIWMMLLPLLGVL
jgi:hypothetical protein